MRGRLGGWHVAKAWILRKVVLSRLGLVDGVGEDSKALLSSAAFASWTGE